MNQPARLRLDQLLVERGFFASRARARDAVLRGTVLVDGENAAKAGQMVAATASVSVADPAQNYVSRAALKLLHGLDALEIDPAGCTALDVGASTGGFTQVLLERGASHVLAIDVGRDQLAETLREDRRVTSIEGLNARELERSHLGNLKIDLVVSDVSFISLKLALPPALALAEPGAKAILLVKPQFEVGREKIGKGGILRDREDGVRVADDLRQWLDQQPGWRATGLVASPIEGGDGNREFLLSGCKDQ